MPAAMLLSALPLAGKQLRNCVCQAVHDWPIPSMSVSLKNCTIDKVSLSIAMAIGKR